VFDVPEARRVDGYVLGDNFGSPYTGRDRLTAGANLNSPLGIGDRLSAFGIVTDGEHLVNGRVAYSAPIGYSGLRGEVSAYRTTYVLGGIYQGLDATGTADAVSATLSYPLLRGRADSIYVSGGYTHKKLNDNILGASVADRNMDLGTLGITRETTGSVIGLPWSTSATISFSGGTVDFPDPAQRAANIAGVDTAGDFAKVNLNFIGTIAFTEKLSLTGSLRAQKSLDGNLDSSEQLGLTGYYGVRSYDEGLAGDSGYIFTPELKYALPDIQRYSHAVGLFTDVGAVWLENPAFTTLQKGYTQLNAVGLGYYASYEYSPSRQLLLKAQVAHSYGSNDGAQSYDRGTKGLVQLGVTF
jgi:hemolysin activation/secretion protein